MTAPPQMSSNSLPETLQPYACMICVQRKVKCDKRLPCVACSRSRLQCRYRTTPPPPRRRRTVEIARAAANQALLEKVRSHEAILRRSGLSFEPFDNGLGGSIDHNDVWADEGGGDAIEIRDPDLEPPPGRASSATANSTEGMNPTVAASNREPLFPRRRGVLIPEYGGRRYYEHDLIGNLGQKYKQYSFKNSLKDSGDDDESLPQPQQQQSFHLFAATVLMGLPAPQGGSKYQHPPPSTVMKYWSIFLERVHPLTKVIHAPTVRQIMIGGGPSLASKSADALRFSIYACAVTSLSDKECQQSFGGSKASMLYALQSATRCALLESSLHQVPDLDLLRAHVLLLTSMLHTSESSSLWIMTGSAIRMAQSQGLHRDGASLGLTLFDTEMRRRLWWYLVTLDCRLTEVMGSENALPRSVDTQMPSNVNDSDLDPEMSTHPSERGGASEMIFCLLKYETTRFLLGRDPRIDVESDAPSISSSLGIGDGVKESAEKKKRQTVSDLESLLEEKLLRFCDPAVPLHLLTTTIARSSICKYRHMEHRGRCDPAKKTSLDTHAEETNNKGILQMATRNISYDNLIHSIPSLSGYLWHVHFYFPWGAPICILKIMACSRSAAEWDNDMHAAWAQILDLHSHHPEFSVPEAERVEHLIIADLTLKAWNTREAVLGGGGIVQMQQTPSVIQALQARKEATISSSNCSDNTTNKMVGWTIETRDGGSLTDMSNVDTAFPLTSFEGLDPSLTEINWMDWGNY